MNNYQKIRKVLSMIDIPKIIRSYLLTIQKNPINQKKKFYAIKSVYF